MNEQTETVTELTHEMGGVWLVTTQGSQHVWGMDAMTYKRIPGAESLAGAFLGDGEAHRIYAVKRYPVVGYGFYVLFDHPLDPCGSTMFNQSSEVVRIERIG